MLRITTADAIDAVKIACSEIESAVGLPVRPELQEIEGGCLILELRLGSQAVHTPHPSRLAAFVDKGAPSVEVLSAWAEQPSDHSPPRRSESVLTALHDAMPPVAHRALHDNLPTAQWESFDASWHLAVPSVRAIQPSVVGLSHRRGYSVRFTSLDVVAIRSGLAS